MALVAILFGAFGVYVGWRWKVLHRAVQDVTRYKASVRAAQKIEREQWGSALLVGVAVVIILVVLAKIHL